MTADHKEEQLAYFADMFSNATRVSMLRRLQGKKMRMSHLAREMEIPIQEVHRNAVKLLDSGLVQKEQNSLLTVTDLGIAANSQLESLEFLSLHRGYFMQHTLLYLPRESFYRVGSLRKCSIMNGAVQIMEKIAEFYDDAAFVKAVVPQVPLDHITRLASHVKERRMNVSYIFGSNTVVPKGRTNLLASIGWDSLIQKGLIKRRMQSKVHVGLVVTDKDAGVIFPTLTGEVDSNTMFYGDERVFVEWCGDLFDQIWQSASDFDERQLRER